MNPTRGSFNPICFLCLHLTRPPPQRLIAPECSESSTKSSLLRLIDGVLEDTGEQEQWMNEEH